MNIKSYMNSLRSTPAILAGIGTGSAPDLEGIDFERILSAIAAYAIGLLFDWIRRKRSKSKKS